MHSDENAVENAIERVLDDIQGLIEMKIARTQATALELTNHHLTTSDRRLQIQSEVDQYTDGLDWVLSLIIARKPSER